MIFAMSNSEALLLTLFTLGLGYLCLWLHVGGLYYLRHPVAEIVDDAMRLGRAREFSLSSMVARMANVPDTELSAECSRFRRQMGVRRTSVWEKLVFNVNRQYLK